MHDIDKIMSMLDWNESIETQQQGMRFAQNINNINVFILPINPGISKNVWENCAKILADRPDKILAPYLIHLLEWLQDLNWPGAVTILERLKTYDEMEMLVFSVECCVEKAIACSKLDEIRFFEEMKFLNNISELLENEKLKENLPKRILEILQKHYNNPGWWDSEYEE